MTKKFIFREFLSYTTSTIAPHIFRAKKQTPSKLLSPCKDLNRLLQSRRTARAHDSGPTDQPPMLLDSSGKRNLLTLLCARGGCELQLRNIGLRGHDLGTGGGGTNVDHEDFVLGELGDLGLLAVGGLDSEETAEKEEVDFKVEVDVGEEGLKTEDLTDETIGTAEGGIDVGTNT